MRPGPRPPAPAVRGTAGSAVSSPDRDCQAEDDGDTAGRGESGQCPLAGEVLNEQARDQRRGSREPGGSQLDRAVDPAPQVLRSGPQHRCEQRRVRDWCHEQWDRGRHRDPRRRILALFDVQAQTFAQPGFRGCAFASALAEAPLGGRVAQAATEFRAWVRSLLTTLCVEAGAADPLELARQLHLIYDGGITAAWIDHDPSIASTSRVAAQALLDAGL